MIHTTPLNPPKLIIDQLYHNKIIFQNDKNIYTDLTGGGTSHQIIGWKNEKVINRIKDQLYNASHIDIKNYIDPNRNILEKLIIDKSEGFFSNIYFSGHSGADGCEAAMKLSFQVHRKNKQVKKTFYLYREDSYHGASSETISISDRANFADFKDLIYSKNKIKIKHHSVANMLLLKDNYNSYLDKSISEFQSIITKIGGENIAAFICESSTGGLHGFSPALNEYFTKISEICSVNNIHLILDEVICGNGTTGLYHNFFHYEKFNPSFLFVSKGLTSGYAPLSLVLINDEISNNLNEIERINHSQTFQGHSTAVAAAIEVQEIVSNDILLNQVKKNFYIIKNIIDELLINSKYYICTTGNGHRFSIQYKTNDNILFSKLITSNCFDRLKLIVDCKWQRITLSPILTQSTNDLIENISSICELFIEIENMIEKNERFN